SLLAPFPYPTLFRSLDEWGADFAVGCTYKYLNAGPGSPAYLYVAHALQELVRNPIPGWHGPAAPFALEPHYRPSAGVRRMVTGSQSIIAIAAIDAALDAFNGVSIADLRATSLSLTDTFIALAEQRLGALGIEPVVP